MLRFSLKGIDGLDGEYDLHFPLTNGDYHVIKQESGVRAGEIGEALDAGDNSVIVAMAYVALLKAGKPLRNADPLWNAPFGSSIDVESVDDDTSEVADLPPDSAQKTDAAS